VVHCGAHYEDRHGMNEYTGELTCGSANVISGVQGCTYGCLGLGDCEAVCDFDAIHMVDGLATVDYDKCVGCGACARACPRNIISMVPFKADEMPTVVCCNGDFGKQVKAVCDVGCTGCKLCTRSCDLFSMEGNLSRIDYDKYDPDQAADLEVALEKCPVKCLAYRGRPADSL
jgi:ferredoxin